MTRLDRWLLAADAVHAVTRLAGAVETLAAAVIERGVRATLGALPVERMGWPFCELRDSAPPPCSEAECDPMFARNREITDIAARVGRIEALIVTMDIRRRHAIRRPIGSSATEAAWNDHNKRTVEIRNDVQRAVDAVVAGAPKGTDR